MNTGDIIRIAYSGYSVTAEVITPPGRTGWVEVEQISGYEDREERPRYKAAIEYCAEGDAPLPPGPFDALVAAFEQLDRR